MLVVKTQGSDQTLRAGSQYRVGRDPRSDIVINDSRVSWQHAVLRVDRDAWVLEDAGSTNGTFLGTRRIGKIEITQNCVLRLGHPDDGPVMLCSVDRGGRAAPPRNTGMSSVDRRPTSVMRAPTRLLRIGRDPRQRPGRPRPQRVPGTTRNCATWATAGTRSSTWAATTARS